MFLLKQEKIISMDENKDKDFDKFTNDLQEQIIEQVRKEYSEAVIDHWQNPRNFEKIEDPDGYAKVTGPCILTCSLFVIFGCSKDKPTNSNNRKDVI